MKEGKASRTADIAVIMRANHSRLPDHERVIYDPLAKRFLTGSYKILHALSRSRLIHNVLWMYSERVGPGTYGWTLARHRFFDDCLKRCIEDGIDQLVILGAGYDARAYRFENLLTGITVFEVDHPDTQKVKKDKIRNLFGNLPDHVVYVSVDFENEKLAKNLSERGYKSNLKTLFIWEAVTMYLTPEAVEDALSFVTENSSEGSSIAFDYVFKSVADGTCALLGAKEFRKRVEEREDSVLFGIEEGNTEAFLSERGFHQITTVTGDFLKKTYFKGELEKYRVAPFIEYVHATVKPRE